MMSNRELNGMKRELFLSASRILFENIRNLFACVAFALVPTGLIKHPEVTNWGALQTQIFIVGGLSISAVLVIWNVAYSGIQLSSLFTSKERELWLGLAGILMIVAGMSLSFFAVAVAVRFV
jgi:hypothetical protein